MTDTTATTGDADRANRRTGLMVLAWAWVGVPFTYGVYQLFLKLTQLFSG
ncbi:hypothetical protein [Nonomuraea sp. B5E05]